jgi:hypothetical protein
MLIKNIRCPILPPLALTSKLKPLTFKELKSKCRFGTLLDSKDLKPLLKPIIKELLELSLFIQSLTKKHSLILKIG